MEALQPGQTLTYQDTQNFFAKNELILADQSKVAYYTNSDSLTGEYAANVVVYRWFDADRNLIGGNYIVYKYDTVSLITTTDVLGSTDELDENNDHKNGKKKPLIIVEGKGQGLGQGKLALRAERSPSSANTHHYELCLVNDSNAKVEFSGSGVVYVPYPDDYDETNCANLEITISHYHSDGSRIKEVFSTAATDEALKITPTKHGLRFIVTSLSPFVVSWEEAAEPGIQQAPQTFALTSVPAALQNEYATPTDLKRAMHELLLEADEKIVGNVAHFDIKLMYTEDGGVTWKSMDDKDWPADKPVEVFLKYEDINPGAGLGKDTHDFHVVHMFAKAGANHAVGDQEYPAVTKEVNGIRFTLKGLSPVSIGWVARKLADDPVNPEYPAVSPDVPRTGDSTLLMALFALMFVSLVGFVALGKRRLNQR